LDDPLDCFRLHGQVALVTGASSGLGARFAQVLDGAGASVVVTARRADRLAGVAQGLANPSLVVAADLLDGQAVDRLVSATVERFGHLDVLVNNAGDARAGPALDEPPADAERMFRVNVAAPLRLAQHAARHMTSQGRGVIVNVASIAGLVGMEVVPLAGYGASKGALIALTRHLAAQWAGGGVRVNALAPGWFPTEMSADALADEQVAAWIRQSTLLGRPGAVEELDGALLFLASAASRYVTGQVLAVDGGWTVR
jgi:NAD(P)-dependent dehydrogenase (short-subunit alcohol dehydrogenase family)